MLPVSRFRLAALLAMGLEPRMQNETTTSACFLHKRTAVRHDTTKSTQGDRAESRQSLRAQVHKQYFGLGLLGFRAWVYDLYISLKQLNSQGVR